MGAANVSSDDAPATSSSAKKALNVEPINAPPPSPLESRTASSSYTDVANASLEASDAPSESKKKKTSNVEGLKGFAAGTASGLTKLTIGHPFDTIKTRMQCSPPGTYTGPLDCLKTVIRGEGLRALYKGASPPAVGWAITDAILLGSLHNYRLLLAKYTPLIRPSSASDAPGSSAKLSVPGHALAGTLAGLTVAVAATPIELVKVQLQMQLVPTSSLLSSSSSSPSSIPTKYISPLGFARQIYSTKGITGFWHGVRATMAQRAWFGVMFGSYDIMLRYARTEVKRKDGSYGPRIKEGTANFLAGGLSSNLFWIFAYPFDNVKNRLMADSITSPRYPSWTAAARAIWAEGGIRSVYRGFVPCILRAFPTNASALFVWESVMRLMQAEKVR